MNVQTPVTRDAPVSTETQSEPLRSTSRIQISLVDLWQVAASRIHIVLGAAVALLVVVVAVTFMLTPLYRATDIVMLQQQETNVVDVQMVLSGLPTDQPSILDQIEILTSRGIADRVISKLHLDRDPEFNGALKYSWKKSLHWLNPLNWLPRSEILSPAEKIQVAHDDIVDAFQKKLKVEQEDLSTSIAVNMESEEPGKSTLIADAIGDAYIEDQLDAKFQATQKATRWLASQLGELAVKARAAEAAAVQFKAENHITDVESPTGGGTVSVLDQQIDAVNTQLVQARTDRALAQANLSRVSSLVRSGHAEEVSQVINSPLITQLREDQATLIQQQQGLASQYGPEHPKMLDLKAEQRQLSAKINEEIAHIVASVQNDVAVSGSRESALSSALKSLELQSTLQGQARIKLAELEANALSSRTLYETFAARAKQTEEQQGLQLPDSRIISRAAIPTSPSFPNKLIVFGIAIPASLFFGFMIAFVMERLDHGFRTAARVEEVLGYPVLATLPDVKVRRKGKNTSNHRGGASVADIVVDRPLSSYSEAIRGLQMGLTLSNVDKVPKVIVLTSAVPNEGKTTLAVSLARHVAQAGQKVVLVDCDLRRPNVRLTTKIEAEFDIVDVLRGTRTLEQALVRDSKTSLDILPALNQVKNAPDLLASDALATIILRLRESYELVVIDAAPILPVNDTKVLTRLVDAVLFVVRWESTPRDAAADAVKSLMDIRAPIVGVALTRADTKRLHYYSFGYGGYYGAYLSYYES